MSGSLSPSEKIDWLRLSRSENVGPITFHQLLLRYGTAAAALAALPELAQRGGSGRPLRIAAKGDAERELAAVERLGAIMIGRSEAAYPPLLAELEDAPPLITLHGDPAIAARPCVAMVGARNASANGMRFAEHLARDLAAAGWVVVSGLARGIDAACHNGALQGGTIAAIAGGINVVYPPEHDKLQAEIARRGALITEAPFGMQPVARHFPRRNRLISGLSSGVIVVEAALRSGSLITARFAGEHGRDVFAVPGSPLDPRCRGTNGLLRDGAYLVEEAGDVLSILKPLRGGLSEPDGDAYGGPLPSDLAESELAKGHKIVLELLDPHPVEIDEVLRRCQLSRAIVLTVLLELELAGRLERHPGNRVSLLIS